jgi:sugar phosphate isomerase/epimerase
MRFGVCTGLGGGATAKPQGWDYVEESAQGLLQGKLPDEQWDGPARLAAAALPVPSVNMLVPGDLKVTGPAVNEEALRQYITRMIRRAGANGIGICVFGSGGARMVPEGFDRATAAGQIVRFLKEASVLAGAAKVRIVVEALNRKECNIINSIPEAMEFVRAVEHPACRCLFDSYHFWEESEPLAHLQAAAKDIAHVHVADLADRVAPGLSGKNDYRPALAILKAAGYEGLISVEALNFDLAANGGRVLRFLREQWEQA